MGSKTYTQQSGMIHLHEIFISGCLLPLGFRTVGAVNARTFSTKQGSETLPIDIRV